MNCYLKRAKFSHGFATENGPEKIGRIFKNVKRMSPHRK